MSKLSALIARLRATLSSDTASQGPHESPCRPDVSSREEVLG